MVEWNSKEAHPEDEGGVQEEHMINNHKSNESQTYENSFGPVTLSLEELYKSSDSAVVSR